MDQITRTHFENKEILVVDYSNSDEAGMIDIVTRAKIIIAAEPNPVLILSLFHEKNYITSAFMRHLETSLKEVEHHIDKSAVVGLSKVKVWILKGLNLILKKDIQPFNTVDEALRFLAKDETVD